MVDNFFIKKSAQRVQFDDLWTDIIGAERALACFGHLIKKISVNGCMMLDINTSVMQSINQHCSTLEELRLSCFTFDETGFTKIRNALSQLKSFQLHFSGHGDKSDFKQLMKFATNLEELSIISRFGNRKTIDVEFLNQKLPSLKKLEIIGAKLSNKKILGQFFKKNPQIKKFNYLPFDKAARQWLEMIIKYVPNIEEIYVCVNSGYDIMNLAEMPKLRRIVIDCKDNEKRLVELLKHLAEQNTIEALGLWSVTMTKELCSELAKFTELQTLELRMVKTDYDSEKLVGYLKKLTHLIELRLDHSTIHSFRDVRPIFNNCTSIERLFLCNLHFIDHAPKPSETTNWRAKRTRKAMLTESKGLDVFVNTIYLDGGLADEFPTGSIAFKPFENKLHEKYNILCSL